VEVQACPLEPRQSVVQSLGLQVAGVFAVLEDRPDRVADGPSQVGNPIHSTLCGPFRPGILTGDVCSTSLFVALGLNSLQNCFQSGSGLKGNPLLAEPVSQVGNHPSVFLAKRYT
jgi:hypothetical protein